VGYCSEAQVQAEFKQLDISTTTAIKTGQIAEFIAESDAEIDAIIGTRYVVPVDDGNALLLCRMMSRALVANRVAGILAIKSGNQKTDQDAGRMSREDVLKLARQIADGKVAFDGATLIAGDGGVKSYVSGTDVERVFKRGDKQW
jgi:hypothetical protein